MSDSFHRISTKALLHLLRSAGPPCGTRAHIQIGISTLLAVCAPRPMTWQELSDYLYGESVDGGPLYVRSSIRVAISKLRHHGIAIKTVPGNRGYYMERAA